MSVMPQILDSSNPAIARLLEDHAKREAAEAQEKRAAAFRKLSELEQQEARELKVLDKQVEAAAAAERSAFAAWKRERSRWAGMKMQRGRRSAVWSARRNTLQRDIAAVTPEAASAFIADAEREIAALAKSGDAVETEREATSFGFRSGPVLLHRRSDQASRQRRIEKLAEAVAKVRKLANENIGDDELAEELEGLRSKLPPLVMEPVVGRQPPPPLPLKGSPPALPAGRLTAAEKSA
jgi:hypothetical protein